LAQEFLPYQIRHLQLSMPLKEMAKELLSDRPQYLVFWWEDIGLGDAYLEPGRELSQSEFVRLATNAIAPAIGHYMAQSRYTGPEWKQIFERGNGKDFGELLHKIIPYKPTGTNVDILPISIIVCTYNRPDSLKKCLGSLAEMCSRPAEIIIVDNYPANPATFDLVRSMEGIKYCIEPKKGLDFARNTGLRNASQPIVAYTDDDVRVHKNWLRHLHDSFDDPSVMAMTGLVITSSIETEAQLIFEKFWSFNRGFVDKTYGPEFFKHTLKQGPPVWEIGAGANMAFRRSIFDEVGYFDERLDAGAAGCNGDSEMWFRILSADHSIVYNPRAIASHEHRSDTKALKNQIFNYMRGFTAACLFQQKQRTETGYRRHLLWVLPKYYLHLLRYGFPKYRMRYSTLLAEVKGILSGWRYYLRHRNKPAYTKNE
jgi:glycosyltransferase involved in cell wall biosynthesis